MITFIFHFLLSVILFFIINWIGKHSFSVGYMQISMFQRDEEAPAFNYLYRILSPTVFIIIVSTILYKFSLDKYVKNIYLIPTYYVAFRILFNIINNRALLINWIRQITTDILIIILAYFSYTGIIITKQNLMPNFSTFSEELWIIIAVFIYQVLNKVELSTDKTIKRKSNYINSRFIKFKKKYHHIITEEIKNEKLISMIYSIMIYEDFNRPKIIRILENFIHKIGNKSRTLGVMQVTSDKGINDEESVKLAIKKIVTHYFKIPEIIKTQNRNNKYYSDFDDDCDEELSPWRIESEILKNYNPDDDYIEEVKSLNYIISHKLKSNDLKYTFEQKTEV